MCHFSRGGFDFGDEGGVFLRSNGMSKLSAGFVTPFIEFLGENLKFPFRGESRRAFNSSLFCNRASKWDLCRDNLHCFYRSATCNNNSLSC